jgi:hypothetical protein
MIGRRFPMRPVALKFVPEELAKDRQAINRMLGEAPTASGPLPHQNTNSNSQGRSSARLQLHEDSVRLHHAKFPYATTGS